MFSSLDALVQISELDTFRTPNASAYGAVCSIHFSQFIQIVQFVTARSGPPTSSPSVQCSTFSRLHVIRLSHLSTARATRCTPCVSRNAVHFAQVSATHEAHTIPYDSSKSVHCTNAVTSCVLTIRTPPLHSLQASHYTQFTSVHVSHHRKAVTTIA